MKRTTLTAVSAALALLMIAGALAGCAKTADVEDVTTPAAEVSTVPEESTPEETKLRPDLAETVWDREFRILGCSADNANSFPSFELYAETLNGDTLNDAIFYRNESVRNAYGISVVQHLVKNPSSRITTEYSSGEDNFDLVFTYINEIGGLAQKGYFLDLKSLGNADLTKPWWNKNVNDAVSVKGHLFFGASDFSLRDKNRIQVIVANDQILSELKLESVPELVRRNAWTAEKAEEYVTAASRDLNGDGKHTAEDQYGIVMHSYDAYASLCFGFGIRLIDKDKDDCLVIVDDGAHASDAIDAVLRICRTETYMTPEKYDKNWDLPFDTFCDGRALFKITLLHSLGGFNSDCEFDFTVCPLPKLNADQEKHYTIPDKIAMLYAVPVTEKDPDFAGFALEALSYASTDTTLVTFVEILSKARNVRNPDSVEMINTILDGVVYDNSIFYSSNIKLYGILNNDVPSADSNVFARSMKIAKNSAESVIKTINNAFQD